MSDIQDALDIAAEERTFRRSSWHAATDEKTHRREANRLRRSIIRFLENVPEEMTVTELRNALDAIPTDGGPDGR